MQPHPEASQPRHRGAYIAPIDPDTVTRVFHTPGPGGVAPGSPDRADHGMGFRSTREVSAEMSPVIYRPAGSGPEHEPERAPRVSIAGPNVPTAASFADTESSTTSEPEPLVDDLDEDPEIDDDELAGEAADELLADDTRTDDTRTDTESADDDAAPNLSGEAEEGPDAGAPLDQHDLLADHDDDDPETSLTAPEPAAPVTPAASSRRRPAQQRRRRRLLGGRHDDPPEPVPAETQRFAAPHERAPGGDVEPTRIPPEVAPLSPLESAEDASPTDDDGPPAATAPDDAPAGLTTRPRRVRTLHIDAPPVGRGDDASLVDSRLDEESADASQHAREAAAITGHVISTRGRGLSGISVVVIDDTDEVVGTAVTGRRGLFVIEGLPSGAYRLGARDTADGDFIDSWHGGDEASAATSIHIEDDRTIQDVDVTLIGRIAIDAAVDARRKRVVVDIDVIDRTTGLPGEGSVTVGTAHFRTQLPLVNGNASITVFATAEDRESNPQRLRIEYAGSQHNGAATRTIRLR